LSQRRPGIEQTGIEEIRTGASRFERELAKPENIIVNGELDEALLVVLHWFLHRLISGLGGMAEIARVS
jgi:hypothetical protein